MTTPLGRRVVRDRLTLSTYAFFITWGWYLYSFSPAVPLIGEELGVSDGIAGLHGTAMAVGTVTTGFAAPSIGRRLGRRRQTMLGSTLVVVGVLGLLAGPSIVFTLAAAFVVSAGGGLALTSITPTLADHHGTAGPAAIAEANGVAAGVGLVAPLALGASVGLGWGWRPAVALAALLAAVAVALVGRVPRTRGKDGEVGALDRRPPPRRTRDDAPSPQWGAAFRFFLVALVCGVAIEFATTFWASDLVTQRTGAPASVGSASVSALIAGMTVARFVAGPVSLRKAPEKLLLVAYALAGLGWLVFWLATTPVVAIVGLAVAGLGYGAHYPLQTSLLLRSSGGRPDQAQARSAVGAGFAIGLAPFVLGALADQVGAHSAFLLVPVLVVVGATSVALGLRAVLRETRAARTTQAGRPPKGRPA